MDSPHLSLAISRKRGPSMHHRHVVVDEQISFLPLEPQTDTIIVDKLLDDLI
jgi:hypothetical protein